MAGTPEPAVRAPAEQKSPRFRVVALRFQCAQKSSSTGTVRKCGLWNPSPGIDSVS